MTRNDGFLAESANRGRPWGGPMPGGNSPFGSYFEPVIFGGLEFQPRQSMMWWTGAFSIAHLPVFRS